ncbi:MAG: serine/threonine protein kinase [Myxococcales bacterium]|nr:serine/threonine protein kinase [Myxococcales bacterium]MCB9652282.1 serine/threonine protein kinase [Deltaproteobacteria bacterium]
MLDVPGQYGGYLLQERLGQGGMAEVYRARDLSRGRERPVVIKRLRPELRGTSTAVRLFVEEARLAASMQHPNIVQVYELLQMPDGDLFITMEHVDGLDLRWLLNMARRRRRRMPVWLAVHFTTEILAALAFLNELEDDNRARRNLVHCDVTPENIFISSSGEVKLGDFGVAVEDARPEDHHLGQLRGKLAYCSPEQAVGDRLDGRSDVYAAAAVLWEALAGRPLVPTRDPRQARAQIAKGHRPPPSAFNPDVPSALEDVVLAALSPERARRTPSARVFRDRLLRVQASLVGTVRAEDVVRGMTALLAPPARGTTPTEALGTARATRTDDLDEHILIGPPEVVVADTPAILPQEELEFPTWLHGPERVSGPWPLHEVLLRLEGWGARGAMDWGVSVTGRDPIPATRFFQVISSGFDMGAAEVAQPLLQTTIEEVGMATIFGQLGRTQMSGILTVTRGAAGGVDRRQIHVAQGRLADARSPMSDVRVWTVSTRPDREGAGVFAAALHRAIAEGRSVLELLRPDRQAELQQTHSFEVRRQVEEVFEWTSGRIRFVPCPMVHGVGAPRLVDLVPALVLQTHDEARLLAALAPFLRRQVVPTPDLEDSLPALDLLEAERDALLTLLAAPSLAEGLAALPQDSVGLAEALIYALHGVALVRFGPPAVDPPSGLF